VLALSGQIWYQLVVLLLAAVLPWMEPEAAGRGASGYSENKAGSSGASDSPAAEFSLLPPGRHGDGKRRSMGDAGGEAGNLQGIHGAAFSWRSTSVAQAWLPTQDAVGRLLQFLARWRQVFNLHRRPLQGFTAAPLFLPKPSGFVPGLVVEGRRWSPLFAGGSIGPDCFSGFFFRVLSALMGVWFFLVVPSVDLVVICTARLILMSSI
jgi:hypothetical protein